MLALNFMPSFLEQQKLPLVPRIGTRNHNIWPSWLINTIPFSLIWRTEWIQFLIILFFLTFKFSFAKVVTHRVYKLQEPLFAILISSTRSQLILFRKKITLFVRKTETIFFKNQVLFNSMYLLLKDMVLKPTWNGKCVFYLNQLVTAWSTGLKNILVLRRNDHLGNNICRRLRIGE